jgi:hypothetical protein
MMMRLKVSTLVDDSLYRRVKLQAVRQGKQISEVLGEALETYLKEKGEPGLSGAAVAETWGILKLDRSRVKRILDDESGVLDS